jgi:hypothetical protein
MSQRESFKPRSPNPGPGNAGWVEIEWDEMRKTRDGREELFFVKGVRTPEGWQFFERSTWEVSWFRVAFSLSQCCIDKAHQILKDVAASPSPVQSNQPQVQMGNIHDNEGVLSAARCTLEAGNPDGAIYVLNALKNHILMGLDPKSKILLPHIEKLLDAATATRKQAVAEKGRSRSELDQRDEPSRAGDEGRKFMLFKGHSVHYLETGLFQASILVTTLTFAFGLLVHDITRTLPWLEAWPTTASVLAGSALIIALRFVLTTS